MPDDTSETNRARSRGMQGDGEVLGTLLTGTRIGSAGWSPCGWIVGCKDGSTHPM